MTTRRESLIVLGAGAFAAPLTSFGQQKKVWRIGFLWEREDSIAYFNAFKAGMSALGYAEGKDFVSEQRSAQSDFGRLPALAAELVALRVDLIVSPSTPSTLAASKATSTVPILMGAVGDPVSSGIAASLARPGGNITGLATLSSDLVSKRLDLMNQLLSGMRRVGLLYNSNNPNNLLELARFESDCRKLQLQPIRAHSSNADELAAAFTTLVGQKAQSLIVGGGSTNYALRKSIIESATKHRLPAVYGNSVFAEMGGLISYAPNYLELFRRAASYADKIFQGAKPSDLPIQQPTTFEFVLNLRTAKVLGLTITPSIQVQATKVIE